jgi:hypothetical protein
MNQSNLLKKSHSSDFLVKKVSKLLIVNLVII